MLINNEYMYIHTSAHTHIHTYTHTCMQVGMQVRWEYKNDNSIFWKIKFSNLNNEHPLER